MTSTMTSLTLFYDSASMLSTCFACTIRFTPGYIYPRTPSSYPEYIFPRTPDIYILVPRIYIPSYPGYLYLRTPDIYILVPRIFIPSYPGYLYSRTPDIYILVPRIFISSYPGYIFLYNPGYIFPYNPGYLVSRGADVFIPCWLDGTDKGIPSTSLPYLNPYFCTPYLYAFYSYPYAPPPFYLSLRRRILGTPPTVSVTWLDGQCHVVGRSVSRGWTVSVTWLDGH